MWVTFFAAMLAATLLLFAFTLIVAEKLIQQHHQQKVDFFAQNPVRKGDIIFLGDSITDGARWDELFPGLPVKNRGINGDTVQGVLKRLHQVTGGQPAAIFLLIGTNDLPWHAYHHDRAILNSYQVILQRILKEAPQTKVFIQSILPRHRRYAIRIQSLNQQLRNLAAQFGYDFIDLFPHFADPNGQIRADYSNDNLHLMASGYTRWVELLIPFIERIHL